MICMRRRVTRKERHAAPLVWYGDDGVSQLALVFLHLVFFFTCSNGSPAECIADSAVDCGVWSEVNELSVSHTL